MLAHVGGTVATLHRDRFGSLGDAGLAPGEMRPLTAAERRALVDMLPLDRVAVRELGGKDARRPAVAAETTAPEVVEEVVVAASDGDAGASGGDTLPEGRAAVVDVRSTLGKRPVRESVGEGRGVDTLAESEPAALLLHASPIRE